MITENKILWCIEQHRNTNHFYDSYLPYEFHLRMVESVAKDFFHLIPEGYKLYAQSTYFDAIRLACYGHDLIEDTRVSFNDVIKTFQNDCAANIVYALTNEKGKNRKERANEKYYEGIRNTKYASFVKLCDRIANVQYSKLTKSGMTDMYKKENDEFEKQLYDEALKPMFDYLKSLFE